MELSNSGLQVNRQRNHATAPRPLYNDREKYLLTARRLMKVKVLSLSLAAIALIGLGACSSNQNTQSGTNSPAATSSAATTTADATAEEPQEDLPSWKVVVRRSNRVYNLAKSGTWDKAAARASGVERGVQGLKNDPAFQSADFTEVDSAVTALKQAVAAKDQTAAMRSANQLIANVAELTKATNPEEPIEVTQLGYYGRALEVEAASQNAPGLEAAKGGLTSTWASLKPQLAAEGDPEQTQQLDTAIAQLEQAKSPQEYTQLAETFLRAEKELTAVFNP